MNNATSPADRREKALDGCVEAAEILEGQGHDLFVITSGSSE